MAVAGIRVDTCTFDPLTYHCPGVGRIRTGILNLRFRSRVVENES
jgi:hypothetical protein